MASISPWIMWQAIDLSRGLVIVAGVWFVASIGGALGTQLPIHLSPSSMTPAIHVVVATCLAGMLVVWPLVRLSQPTIPQAIARTAVDALTLACLWQLVLWPLRLATPWTIDRTLSVDLLALSSLAAALGFVAAGSAWPHALSRSLAMIGCLVIAVGLPVPLAALGFSSGEIASLFPGALTALTRIVEHPGSLPSDGAWGDAIARAALHGAICLVGILIALFGGGRIPSNAHPTATGRRVG
ncbi:MAG: hypothetical protein EXS01_04780 [Phycisphaerales bacterium]|nr:hypothetical protein [Phycisphaerales bacterium]